MLREEHRGEPAPAITNTPSYLNPFVVQRAMGAVRGRRVLLQAGNLVRVLDLETERTIHDFSTRSPTTECRGLGPVTVGQENDGEWLDVWAQASRPSSA